MWDDFVLYEYQSPANYALVYFSFEKTIIQELNFDPF